MTTAVRWTIRSYRYDQLTFWRMPQAAFFTMVLPVMMLVIFSALNPGELDELDTAYRRYLLVGMVVFGLSSGAYGNMAARLVYRRETGIFQRLRTTPLPASSLVAGQVLSAVTTVVLTLAMLLLVSVTFFDVAMPTNWPLFGLIVLLGAACCCALGAAVSTLVTRVEAADPVVFATMLPITFISGVFDYMPGDSLMARIADLFPVRHLVLANMRAFGLPGSGSLTAHLLVLLAWTALGIAVAVRRFRWAPHR